jgi:hypothetical protein
MLGEKITIFENIVPSYELLYNSKEKEGGFINNFKLNGNLITKQNYNDFFEENNFEKLFQSFMDTVYQEKDGIAHDSDIEETNIPNLNQGGGAKNKFMRGASYKFYGVRGPDSKELETLSSEKKILYFIRFIL